MRRSLWLSLAALAGLAWLVFATVDFGPSQTSAVSLREATERLFVRGDLQFELPGWDDADTGPSRPLEGDWRVEERDLVEPPNWMLDLDLNLDFGLPPFWRLLVWSVAICCVLLIVYWLVDSWAGFRPTGPRRKACDVTRGRHGSIPGRGGAGPG